mmetsp:Transcript_63690/g.197389  ORF Transcript_63690/g.197389 Transcript_63690/m.197389 type:complete len:261 (-) Transcript_63690:2-784(-)
MEAFEHVSHEGPGGAQVHADVHHVGAREALHPSPRASTLPSALAEHHGQHWPVVPVALGHSAEARLRLAPVGQEHVGRPLRVREPRVELARLLAADHQAARLAGGLVDGLPPDLVLPLVAALVAPDDAPPGRRGAALPGRSAGGAARRAVVAHAGRGLPAAGPSRRRGRGRRGPVVAVGAGIALRLRVGPAYRLAGHVLAGVVAVLGRALLGLLVVEVGLCGAGVALGEALLREALLALHCTIARVEGRCAQRCPTSLKP